MHVVVLGYRDGTGRRSRREVEPQLLARVADREYLVAWCRERQTVRWFRWDRVESAELSGERAPRRDPASFGAPPKGRGAAATERRAPSTEGTPRGGRWAVRGPRSPGSHPG